MTPYRILSQIIAPALLIALYSAILWSSRRRLERLGMVRVSRWSAATAIGFSALDGALLAALTPLGLSFGPIGLALIFFTGTRLFLAGSLAISLRGSDRHNPQAMFPSFVRAGFIATHLPRFARVGLAVLLALNLGLLAVEIDALYIEPFDLQVTQVSVPGPARLRIVHLSDLHVERLTRREQEMVAIVNRLQPDLIVLTGDYLNQEYLYDPQARHDARTILSQLNAPYGVYAIAGSVDTPQDMAAIFGGLDITLLDDEILRLPLEGGDLYLVGITHRGLSYDAPVLAGLMRSIPTSGYTLLLYHTPDLIEIAAAEGIDLYLAGHTHGGQVRLPFYGAIITFSAYGKQYEMGRYTVGPTTLYVSRGIGMEGLGLPRMRFLCPPEIVQYSVFSGQ